jgi:hypothetical protein
MSEKIILGLPLVNIVARKLVELVNIGYNIYKIYVVQQWMVTSTGIRNMKQNGCKGEIKRFLKLLLQVRGRCV